jgi:hypothetical protein
MWFRQQVAIELTLNVKRALLLSPILYPPSALTGERKAALLAEGKMVRKIWRRIGKIKKKMKLLA